MVSYSFLPTGAAQLPSVASFHLAGYSHGHVIGGIFNQIFHHTLGVNGIN